MFVPNLCWAIVLQTLIINLLHSAAHHADEVGAEDAEDRAQQTAIHAKYEKYSCAPTHGGDEP